MGVADVFMTVYYPAASNFGGVNFWTSHTLRLLGLCVFQSAIALLIYLSSTNRFFFGVAPTDDSVIRRKQLAQTNVSLQTAHTNLRAYSIVRNAVVRNPTLKSVDDDYWRQVVAVEADTFGRGSVFDDDEVQAAIARAYGSGSADVTAVTRDAEAFVRHATAGLDSPDT